ncbi:acylphosphatase [Methanofollis fontis]|uniref:acylphosphatase n=1 Tax=Methanofollis fontis TaxID=2052832 RepID=A0A483CWT9_9EURY|nr:acylphosphatase [Methanofollis fontis]TAJ44176.1 acylphosphatase [Methanofollis fontis]
MNSIRIRISGRVQHVGFRACTRKIAVNLRLGGSVRNLDDGAVEILATGDMAVLEKFIGMLYGCPRAVIRDIEVKEIPLLHQDGFFVLRNTIQ